MAAGRKIQMQFCLMYKHLTVQITAIPALAELFFLLLLFSILILSFFVGLFSHISFRFSLLLLILNIVRCNAEAPMSKPPVFFNKGLFLVWTCVDKPMYTDSDGGSLVCALNHSWLHCWFGYIKPKQLWNSFSSLCMYMICLHTGIWQQASVLLH